nr:McrB 51 kda polypeptide [Escherichia coli, K-12, Peptide Partial, 10 aa] [Escherichia coli]
MESIQPWIEK